MKAGIYVSTLNSEYVFQDMGDGAFQLTSNNPEYPGPVLVKPHGLPVVHESFYCTFMDGPKKGRTLITSAVQSFKVVH